MGIFVQRSILLARPPEALHHHARRAFREAGSKRKTLLNQSTPSRSMTLVGICTFSSFWKAAYCALSKGSSRGAYMQPLTDELDVTSRVSAQTMYNV